MNTPQIIDQAALDRLVEWGGDKLLRQMLRLYLENAQERLVQIEGGLAGEGDLDESYRGAHSLKSSAANLGAMQVSELAGRLEAVAKGGDAAGARTLFDELVAAHAVADAQLKHVLEGLPE